MYQFEQNFPPLLFFESFHLPLPYLRKVPGRFLASGSLVTVVFYVRSDFEYRTLCHLGRFRF